MKYSSWYIALIFLSLAPTIHTMEEEKEEEKIDIDHQILDLSDQEGRTIKIDVLVSDYLDSKNTLDPEKAKALKEALKSLSVSEYNEKIIKGLKITKGKKNKNRNELVAVMFQIVEQLKEQNKNMESSSELAQEVHAWNIKKYRWGIVGTVVMAVLTNGIQFAINMYQATDECTCP